MGPYLAGARFHGEPMPIGEACAGSRINGLSKCVQTDRISHVQLGKP